jgi:hypothetical protein
MGLARKAGGVALTDPVPVRTYEDLVRAFTARRKALGLSQRDVDAMAGVADGYTSKVEMSAGGSTATNARGIGRQSLPRLLSAVGLTMVLVDNSSPLSRVVSRPCRSAQSEGGIKGSANMTPEARRERASIAARARHEKARREAGRVSGRPQTGMV